MTMAPTAHGRSAQLRSCGGSVLLSIAILLRHSCAMVSGVRCVACVLMSLPLFLPRLRPARVQRMGWRKSELCSPAPSEACFGTLHPRCGRFGRSAADGRYSPRIPSNWRPFLWLLANGVFSQRFEINSCRDNSKINVARQSTKR